MMTHSIWLSVALQSSMQEYLFLFLFLIIAIIFFAVFFSWWRGVSEEDLKEVIAYETNQTTGPAMTGAEMPVYAHAEAYAVSDLEALLAEEAEFAATAAHQAEVDDEALTETAE